MFVCLLLLCFQYSCTDESWFKVLTSITSPWPVYTLEFYVGVDFIDDLVFRRSQVLLHGNVHLITFDLPDLQN